MSATRWRENVGVLALGAAFALVLSGCLQRACREAGCTSGISAKIVGEFAESPASVRACLGQACAVVPWPARGASCEEVEAAWRLSVCLQDDGSMITLSFAEGDRVNDGAPFELLVETAEGEALLHETESVRFSDSYPNGKRCPGRCQYANFRY
jgi:hypothetical protein